MWTVRVLSEIDDVVVEDMGRLLELLAADSVPPTKEYLEEIIADHDILVVVREGHIVGTLTLLKIRQPIGRTCRIEDCIVDLEYRGQGLGIRLIKAAIKQAREWDARFIDLNSNPTREAANSLYVKMGFFQRKTNVYRLLSSFS
ncbi:MAG: uncharacterized protein KVP18_000389 [Porospora cf. gigantea A]|uniref:uncharacterized protein n=1 Tax=Porospora cf. gigantea A TaxID=2853593 RepID=UPI003559D388|nr:MAG: hypothetical protein KVP18_000389 [Porospora cf. gigantea A]